MQTNFSFLSAALTANLKPGGTLKWKKRLVKDIKLLLTDKVFAYRRDEARQAYISAFRHALSVIAKDEAEAWQATCSFCSLF